MKKPKLYIIHGWTYTVTPWERTIAQLEKYGLSVEMLHVPGLTASSKKVWTIDEYVAWADRHIPDGAVALGHSNGGRILLNLCSAKPDKLSQLILLDAAGVYENSAKRDVSRSLSKRFGFLKKIPGLAKVWHKLTGASDYARAPENMKKTLSNMLSSDKHLDLSKVTTPTSILWGAADTVTPPHQAEIMHSKIATSTLEIFPEWTHAPYISHPDALAKAIFRVYKNPPVRMNPVVTTETASISASMALKKAAEPEVPSTAPISATLAFKKASGPGAPDTTSRSATLVVPSSKQKTVSTTPNKVDQLDSKPKTTIVEELAEVDYEQTESDILPEPAPRKVITTASVPKISKIERARRKIGAKPKVATKKPKTSTKTKSSASSKSKKTGQKGNK